MNTLVHLSILSYRLVVLRSLSLDLPCVGAQVLLRPFQPRSVPPVTRQTYPITLCVVDRVVCLTEVPCGPYNNYLSQPGVVAHDLIFPDSPTYQCYLRFQEHLGAP